MMAKLRKVGLYEIFIFVTVFNFYLGFSSAHAEQVFTVKNNGVVSATASLKELTRIAFEDDEVDSIYALSGEMTHEVKNNNLFIKLKSEKAISFFVLTKNANVYKIILKPKNIKATQLFIKTATEQERKVTERKLMENGTTQNDQGSPPHPSYSEEGLLRQNIAAIIKVVLADEHKVGFEVEIDEDNIGQYGWFYLKQLSVWTGRGLTAKKILVTNTEDKCVLLSNRDFRRIKLSHFSTKEFRPLAVYLEKNSLKPFESTHLILITKSE